MGGFSPAEFEAIHEVSRRLRADIDLARVVDILEGDTFSPDAELAAVLRDPNKAQATAPELWAALVIHRHRTDRGNADNGILAALETSGSGAIASMSLQFIREIGAFQRVDPVLRRLFALRPAQLDRLDQYRRSLSDTSYPAVMKRHRSAFVSEYDAWSREELTTENLGLARTLYERCLEIAALGLPHLVALDRADRSLSVNMQTLRERSLATLLEELAASDRDEQPYRGISDAIDVAIRESIQADTFSIDAEAAVVHAGSTTTYPFDAFDRQVNGAVGVAMFLSSTILPLVSWHASTAGTEYRQEHPRWVFTSQEE